MSDGFSVADIERAAASAVMQWPRVSVALAKERGLTGDHFHDFAPKTIFEHCISLYDSGKEFDLISLTHELRRDGTLAKVGGEGGLTSMYLLCPSPDMLDYYADILEERRAKILLGESGRELARKSDDPTTDTSILLPETIAKITSITLPRQHRKHRTLAEAAQEKMNRMEQGKMSEDIVKTGIAKLDHESPLRRGDMPIIAGQRKVGKSILSLTIATNAAMSGVPVLYFSLEDREPKVVDRLFAAVSRIPMNDHHISVLNEQGMKKASDAVSRISSLPMVIKDDIFDLAQIIATCREFKALKKLGLAVIDYAQLVRSQGKKDSNREQEVAGVSRSLRLLAMELDTPIILLSQLNKEGVTRESSAIENDTTAMWLITSEEDEVRKRWIEIPFQRNGTSGIRFPVTFLGEIARIENYANEINIVKKN